MVDEVEQQKTKLQQKKARLVLEEARLRIKERKNRTRRLIELGGLIVKADLDLLPTNTLFGSLISLQEAIKTNPKIKDIWAKTGKELLDKEANEKLPVILQLTNKPDQDIRDQIRSHGLKWNSLRSEWYGYVTDLDSLKQLLKDIDHNLEIIK